MEIYEILLIAVSLASDAFAVSLSKGMSVSKLKLGYIFKVGFYFGSFQFLMPILGYLLSNRFGVYVSMFDHWIAFILLCVIGINMIRENDADEDDDFSFKKMIVLAVATSIDACAVGITFTFMNVNIIFSSFFIGIITFVLSIIGIIIGKKINNNFGKMSKLIGGIILILLGVKILFQL